MFRLSTADPALHAAFSAADQQSRQSAAQFICEAALRAAGLDDPVLLRALTQRHPCPNDVLALVTSACGSWDDMYLALHDDPDADPAEAQRLFRRARACFALRDLLLRDLDSAIYEGTVAIDDNATILAEVFRRLAATTK